MSGPLLPGRPGLRKQIHWAWSLAIRTAYDLGDICTVRELLAMIDDCPPGHLTRLSDTEAAEPAISEARNIGGVIRCQPLPDRAADLTREELRIGAPMARAPGSAGSATAQDR